MQAVLKIVVRKNINPSIHLVTECRNQDHLTGIHFSQCFQLFFFFRLLHL